MSLWTIAWLLWFLWFAIEEGLALAIGGWRATLSGHVWIWFAIKTLDGQPAPHWRIRRFALASFLAWLCLHFLSGGQW